MYMAMLVLNDPDRLHEVLEAWDQVGITGVTIFETTGMYRVRRRFIPVRYAVPWAAREECHVTLMAIVQDEEQTQAALTAAESVIGDLEGPDSGVFAAWPLGVVKGTTRQEP